MSKNVVSRKSFHNQSSCRSIKQTNYLRTTLNKPSAIFSTNFFDNFLNLSLFSNIIHFPYNCQSFIISNIGKSTWILLFPCLNFFQSCTTRIPVIFITIGNIWSLFLQYYALARCLNSQKRRDHVCYLLKGWFAPLNACYFNKQTSINSLTDANNYVKNYVNH